MKPHYQDGGVTLYHGDCRDVLASVKLPDIYTLITDPPYYMPNDFGQMKGRRLSFEWEGGLTPDEVVQAVGRWAVTTQSAVVFCGPEATHQIADSLRTCGLTVKPAVWVKKHPPPALPGNWWPSGFDMVVYGYRSGAYFDDLDIHRTNVWVYDAMRYGRPDKIGHPTQKPLELMMYLVRTLAGDGYVVVDPFAGSGTTLVAAKRLGVPAIGVEIGEQYCEMAVKRLAQGVLPYARSE